jgi:ferredoxin/flavodoxin---NADP+ reductase
METKGEMSRRSGTDTRLGQLQFTAGEGYQVLERKNLAPRIHLFKIAAPHVARKALAGQFIIIRLDEFGERIPLTLADWSRQDGTITIVFMEVGASTMMLATLGEGEYIKDVVGPLGVPSEMENFGHVVCVAGGVGVAPVTPIAKALKAAGNRVTSILGARTRELVFWEEQLKSASDKLIVTTDDGTYGRKALVTEPLTELLKTEKVDRVLAIGPAIMMKFCAKATEPFGVKTLVSLNPIMVDGTGMCGCCRVSIGGETKFTCVDGPEFDAAKVDWDLLLTRQKTYPEKEAHALEDCKWRAFQKTLVDGGSDK